jgi:phage N-6-adenine-methyltransferase
MKIDAEFQSLIPPLTYEEKKMLEESILNEGCRDAIVVWNDTIIDGHNRYEICTKHNIPFETVNRDFDSRNDAIEWIIKNQFGRRNLPLHERARLALRLKPVIAEKAKSNKQEAANKMNLIVGNNVSTEICENVLPIDTQKEIAKAAGVSHDTIAKVEKIEQAAPAPIVQASRKGDISVNAAYQVTKMMQEEQEEIASRIQSGENAKSVVLEVQKRPHVANNSGNNEWYTPAEYIEAARKAMGSIDTDPASNDIANKVVKAEKYYTIETDGLAHDWHGNVWMNPPYSSDLITKFIEKLKEQRGNYEQAIILVNNATETQWFYEIVKIASAVCFPKSRVKFYMPDGKTGAPLQGQAVLYVGNNTEKFISAFGGIGWTAKITEV